MSRIELKQTVRKKTTKKEPEQKTLGPGRAKLSKRADRVLGDNCEQITKCLVDLAVKGDRESMKDLLELAEGAGRTGNRAKMARVISLAESLLAEPEWGGESSEATAQTHAGAREPEN